MIKVCLVDDHKMMSEGLKTLLQEDKSISVINEAESAAQFFEILKPEAWDVIILDISLPDENGLSILKKIRAKDKTVPVLILTMYNEEQYGIRAFKAGASGYMTKDAAPDDLILAVKKLSDGHRYITPNLGELLADSLQKQSVVSHDELSDREFEVLKLIGKGKSLSEIGTQFSLSIKTISTYRTRILSKMGFSNNADIIRYCINNHVE
ncbi:MAG: two-component system invasion response regulator UvrY [Candidatus Marinamargulisbacteria bacterium]|jgi:two-component system invasion response regulator UvrY